MIGVEHVVAVNNGTTALIAALDVLDLQPGDEVDHEPVHLRRHTQRDHRIRCDGAVRRHRRRRLQHRLRTATEAVDHGSHEGADAGAPLRPVRRHGSSRSASRPQCGLDVVEDAAQAHGARIGDRIAGSWGIGCFSLYATKNLTTGEGGLISTNDASIADRLRVLRNQGMRQRYVYEMAGNNYRMTDLQAALCLPQLGGYGATRCRSASATRRCLSDGLRGLAGVRVPETLPGRHHVWHQYTILVDDEARLNRDDCWPRS